MTWMEETGPDRHVMLSLSPHNVLPVIRGVGGRGPGCGLIVWNLAARAVTAALAG
jgi:hypothetical protein